MFHCGYCGYKLDHDLNTAKNTAQEAERPYRDGKRGVGTFAPYSVNAAFMAGSRVAGHDKAGHLLGWGYPALPCCA